VAFHVEDHPDPLDLEFLETQIRREASAAMGARTGLRTASQNVPGSLLQQATTRGPPPVRGRA
jgi:hypothetical protein